MTMFETSTKAPGVYIQEEPATGPIAGTGTSTAAFIGTVKKEVQAADLGTPVLVTNWTDYTQRFGDYDETRPVATHLPFAVRGFFENGGTMAYVVPVKDVGGLDAALTNLRVRTDVSMVCLPGETQSANQRKVIEHCDKLGDRVAILDGAPDTDPLKDTGPLQKQKKDLVSTRGFGALYWPWIQIADPKAPDAPPISTPPSGHIAGVIARSDGQRGVHKAPANEQVIGALGLDYYLDNTAHGTLNNLNINALRVFPSGPPLVWGARTLTDGTPWLHLNVRRLMCFIEDSIVSGTRWAVFESNSVGLWKRLDLTISEFLTRVWRSGALFGATADQAFYVKIDEELNPPSTQALGQLFGEIGVAPVHPAEYVVFRVGMWDGGAQITET